ncbi:hypothetical protein ONZ45_g10713 [Pleurotus djamor]|nr:hypothetical protein ONZ45_g10713 [Pleurotus djamor]
MPLNVTIDDEYGDLLTGALPSYEQADAWHQGNSCLPCAAKLNSSKTFMQTWHDNTSNGGKLVSMTFNFTGTALYVYCVIPPHSVAGYSFRINNTLVGQYTRQTDEISAYEYQTLVFAKTDLPQGHHTFQFRNGRGPSISSLALFDYAVYTMDNSIGNTTETVSPTTATRSETSKGASPTPLQSSIGYERTDTNTSSSPTSSGNTLTPSGSKPAFHVQVAPLVIGILIGSVAAVYLGYLFFKLKFARRSVTSPATVEPFPFVENWREVYGTDPLSPPLSGATHTKRS